MAEQKIQVISRAFVVIECLSEFPVGLGVTEIATRIQLNKSTVFRILNTLVDLGYIEKNTQNERYRLSLKFLQLSSMMINQTELKVVAYPHLKRLASKTLQAVHLCVRKGDSAQYLDKVEAYNHSIKMYSAIGVSVPLYCSGVGKCLLAWMDSEEKNEVLNELEFVPRCKNTILQRKVLESELKRIIDNGYAVDDEENEDGVRCAAAPIRDYTGKVIAAISVSGNYASVNSEEFLLAVDDVIYTARQISKELGYSK